MPENIVLEKAYKFALRIVRLYKYLVEEKKEYVMSRELLRAGTKLGEHVELAQEAASKAGFAHDMNTALQFARSTGFWLRLLHDSLYLEEKEYHSIYDDCQELKRILKAIGVKVDPRTRH